MMNQRELTILVGSVALVFFALAIMVSLHEKHYRERRVKIDPDLGIEDRLSNIEKILLEDRYT
jgi:hypothetical protein